MKYCQIPPERNPSSDNTKDIHERIELLNTNKLIPFNAHPFKVVEDDQMQKLRESIASEGIIVPLIVRPHEYDSGNCDQGNYNLEGAADQQRYDIISGHRRFYVANQLGMDKVPVIIREISYEEAVLCMVDANFQREHISPSEKAFAYKMRCEAMRKLPNSRPLETLSQEYEISIKKIQRYIKLTELSPVLLKWTDQGRLSVTPAYHLAFLSSQEQEWLVDAMEFTQSSPSLSQAMRIKSLSQNGELTIKKMEVILSETKKDEIQRVTFRTTQLHKYFPNDWTVSQMKNYILHILETFSDPKDILSG